MISTLARWLLAVTLAAVLVLALFGAWLGWRLRQGPLRVPALDPYVARVFAGDDDDLRVAFEATILVWPPERRLPEMRVLRLRVTRANGRVVADFPELSFRPSARALLRGRLAVGAIGLSGVRLSIARDAKGRLSLSGVKPADADAESPSPLAWLADSGDPDSPNAYLRRVSLRDGEVVLDDRASTSKWRATRADLDLHRRADQIDADLRAEVVVRFEAATVRLPLQARATASIGEAATIAAVEFEAEGTGGRFDRGVEGRSAVPIRSIEIDGRYVGESGTLELRKLQLRSGNSRVQASGTIAGSTHDARFHGSVLDFPVGELDLAWPPGVAPGARTWVLGNLRDGRITKADFTVRHPGGDRGSTDFRLEAAVAGMTVDYLAPLEPLRAVDGSVTITEKQLDASASAGTVGSLNLTRGAVTIDLAAELASAKVDADLEGPTDDLLAFLDSPPLGVPSRFGLPTKGIGGRTAGHVELRFPLAGESTAAGLEIDARADLHGEGAEGVLAASVTAGELRKFEIQRFRSARNDLSGTVERSDDGGFRASLSGAKLDLQPLIERWRSGQKATPTIERPYAIRFDLERVAAASGVEWTNVHGELAGDGQRVRRVKATAVLDGGGASRISVEPVANGRSLQGTSEDAGRVLQAFGLIEQASGGRLELYAVTDDRGPETKSTGRLELSDLRVMQASLLARILSLGSFDGIADVFRDDGITFRRARLPFTWSKDKITLTDARAIGAIGLTGDGTIVVSTGELDLRGQVIPAYTLNTALGRVPLIGELFVGGKGGGLFGISYRVKGTRQAPDVSVNPLTALAPGKLREMFLTPFGL